MTENKETKEPPKTQKQNPPPNLEHKAAFDSVSTSKNQKAGQNQSK